jgi:hypothetical protein
MFNVKNNAANTDEYLKGLPDWQIENLQTFRDLVHEMISDVAEEIKWGVPVFVHNSKVIFSMASFKEHTKYNFILNGSRLNDSHQLFNNGLESKKSRSIDLRKGEKVDFDQLRDLVKKAVIDV